MSGADSESETVRSMLADVVAEPESGRRSLPRLFGCLDDEDRSVRIGAACAICLVASVDTEIVDYIVRRLVDRLDDETSRAETILTFEYLTTQYPKIVDETLQELREERDREPLRYTREGGFLRSNYLQPSGGTREDVGRLRTAGEDGVADPGLVYGDDGPERRPGERLDPDAEREPEADEERSEPAEESGAAGSAGTGETTRDRINRLSERVESIVDVSVFDQLVLLTGHSAGPYADNYQVLATRSGREEALSLRLFNEPTANRETFRSNLAGVLDQWEALEVHDNVVTLYDGGREPQPWGASQHTDLTLATDSVTWTAAEAIETTAALAGGLSTLHQRGIVHGGIDPESVALTFDGGDRTAKLDNVGLLTVFRWYLDPAACLDPRFSAPEYFDASFGAVDQATDVYHLGAILYFMLTGEPPYEGSYQEVRERVRDDGEPAPPSAVGDDVPMAVNDVVSKAMARQKLTRYETAVAFRQDLLRVREAQ